MHLVVVQTCQRFLHLINAIRPFRTLRKRPHLPFQQVSAHPPSFRPAGKHSHRKQIPRERKDQLRWKTMKALGLPYSTSSANTSLIVTHNEAQRSLASPVSQPNPTLTIANSFFLTLARPLVLQWVNKRREHTFIVSSSFAVLEARGLGLDEVYERVVRLEKVY